MNFAVILAAGSSKRMRGIDKIFYQVKKKPLIFYTILTFEKHPKIRKIILVARKKNFKKFLLLIKKYRFKKIESIIEGGQKRQDSAFKGLKVVKNLGAQLGDLILFHNGANPFVSRKEISEVLIVAKRYGAALVGQPAKDTIKEADKGGRILRTINRKNIYLAQTPQVIEYKLAEKAFSEALKEDFYGTDEVSLVERLRKQVRVVPCSYKNIKVTTKEDLIFDFAKHVQTNF